MPDQSSSLVNNFVKSRFVPFRHQRDPSATDRAFTSRADLFEQLGPARIEEIEDPSLISTLHGTIDGLLLTIPRWVFLDESSPNYSNVIQKYVDVYRQIFSTFPASSELTVFTHRDSVEDVESWIAEFGMESETNVVSVSNDTQFTVWAEDPYCITEDRSDKESFFIEPASFRRAEDAYIADRVAEQTQYKQTKASLYFQGGNILIGDDFWLLGADYANRSLELGLVERKEGESKSDAISRRFGSTLDNDRELVLVGSRVPVPSQTTRSITVDGESWKEVLYFGNSDGTVQPIFHIDMFISLLGRDDEGEYTLSVGSPKKAADILGEEVPDGAMQTVFDDIAAGLESEGFNIVRNPLPMAYDDDDRRNRRYWYFASSNNVYSQTDPKKVWLPTYGHGPWSKLEATDDANRQMWEDFGYEVEPLPDFHPFAANLGAAHCITKYLDRE